ncbi:Crp/Fnr family transcriptional regulator [Labilibacter marinus]|uniref:Crp/Fnr family transcriptional regulator n=1 Tax=Labilibacter marinus TaxID=1477105 RepID=UPI000831EC88|nr:Crp/Fnr family transcriptional regulator [Labilibacter marinus]
MTQSVEEIIKAKFPVLYEPELVTEIQKFGKIVNFNAGSNLIEIGAYIKQMPLLIEGTLKISREDSEGNELLLYYLNSGETCAMSLTCCMGDVKSNIKASAIEDAEIIMLPTHKMDEWMKKFDSWKNFIFRAYQIRFDEMLHTIDSIAFMKMDERLERYLLERSKELNAKILNLTHQEIASDLNTSREVISRLLKQLEKLGRIKLHRYKVELI